MTSKRVGILDYGMGNLRSVFNAVTHLGSEPTLCDTPDKLSSMTHLLLPGVGAFGQCISRLKESGFADALNEEVLHNKKPILGICLGMQVMASHSLEGGDWEGLGWFDADVISLRPQAGKYTVPHTGWETVQPRKGAPLFIGLSGDAAVYFVHSYHMKCSYQQEITATCSHSEVFTASIQRENIFGTQFHPEKSQLTGLKIIENFLEWDGA